MSGEFAAAKWTAATSVGGQWDWDYQQFGFTAGISVYRPTAGVAVARIDSATPVGAG